MPTLGDLFERLADDGDVAGFDAVLSRAVAALEARPASVPMTPPRPTRRRAGWTAAVAIAAAAAIAVPLIVTRNNSHNGSATKPTHVSTGPSAMVFPNAPSATAAQLATWKWTWTAPPEPLGDAQVIGWDGQEILVHAAEIPYHHKIRWAPAPNEVWAFTPSTNTWIKLNSPLPAGQTISAWDGHEMLMWINDPKLGLTSGWSYDPASQQWQRISVPAGVCPLTSPVWTGSEAVVFSHAPGASSGAISGCEDPAGSSIWNVTAYDVASGRWITDLPTPPGESVRIDATFAAGLVVARVESSFSTSVRVIAWRPGSTSWTTLPAPKSVEAPLALSAGAIIPPGPTCNIGDCGFTPYSAGTGRYYPASAPSRTIPVPEFASHTPSLSASTGDAIVVMAGANPLVASAWDPRTGRWTPLPDGNAREAPNKFDEFVWTGGALVGLLNKNPQRTYANENWLRLEVLKPAEAPPAAAPQPASVDALRHFHWSTAGALPTYPPQAVLWDGTDALGWTLNGPGNTPLGEAFDPTTNRWHTIAAPPTGMSWDLSTAVWTGQVVVMIAARASGGELPGAVYDPRSDSWRTTGPVPLCAMPGRHIVSDGTYALATPGQRDGPGSTGCAYGDTARYDPTTNSWSSAPRLPVSDAHGAFAQAVGADERVIVLVRQGGGNSLEPPATYSAFELLTGSSHWIRLPGVPTALPGDIDSDVTTAHYLVIPPTGGCSDPACAAQAKQFQVGYLIDADTGTVRSIHADESRMWNEGVAITSVVDTGSAIFNIAYGDGGDAGTPVYAYAWDARGTDVALPSPHDCKCGNQQVPSGPGVWTGHELLFFGGATALWRFGP
ncbi:MAG TPA: hypothetical protein VGO03_17090 [Acidimicrobiia bacterium]|jgi:hypothetical protein